MQDILNHVMEDLDNFKFILKSKAAAWADLEKKRKKSRRKKHDGNYFDLTYCVIVYPAVSVLFHRATLLLHRLIVGIKAWKQTKL
jgi:hypothetical protein